MVSVVNVVCYSYKGGSGRSTAAVNIAFELARQGKKVACLDMDVGAPGLHMIMQDWNSKAAAFIKDNDGLVGLQDFLNLGNPGKRDLDHLKSAILDVEDCHPTALGGNDGRLWFLFSSTRHRTLTDLNGSSGGDDQFLEKFRILQEAIAHGLTDGGRLGQQVYLVVDAPNGITPVSLPLLRSADVILMFYRHSLQHVQGTIETANKIRFYILPEMDYRFARILLVGSCVPDRLIDALLQTAEKARETKAVDLNNYEFDMVQRFNGIREALSKFAARHPEIVHLESKILEDDVLKILEQPLLSDGIRMKVLGLSDDIRVTSSARTRQQIKDIVGTVTSYGGEVIRRKYPSAS